MKKGNFDSIKLEKEICLVANREGLGSIYERIMLKRFFDDLVRKYAFRTVLEYQGLAITKGIDNITFLRLGKEVTVTDKKIDQVRKNWPFEEKPYFSLLQERQSKFDLVWNFAVIQLQPQMIKEMTALSKRFVLIFVPNFLNWGMPAHLLYHFLTRTNCRHAEKGSAFLRTQWGLKRLAKNQGIEVIKTGYIDIPPLPDIGFSIKELKKQLGFRIRSQKRSPTRNAKEVLERVEQMAFLERRSLPRIIQLPLAHHLFLLGRKK